MKDFFREKMKVYYNLTRNRNYIRAISLFYSCYSMALSTLEIQDEQHKKKERVWRKYLASLGTPIQKNYLKKLLIFMQEDILIIFKAQQKLIEIEKQGKYVDDSIERSKAIAISIYDSPFLEQ